MQKSIRMTDISIVPMNMEHLESVVDIERDVFHNPWSHDMYKAEILKDYSHHYVAIYKDELIGYYGFFNIEEDVAEVTNIAVKSSYQGNGIGSLLVDSMLNNAKVLGINKIFLETRESNIRARSLYEKYSFKLINIRKKYYDGVENACIYMWER